MFKLFSKKEENTNDFAAVVSGKIIPLTAVNDDVFSKGMMGTGVAIVPDDDVIVAPCDGEVTMLFPTIHAFGMKNEDGEKTASGYSGRLQFPTSLTWRFTRPDPLRGQASGLSECSRPCRPEASPRGRPSSQFRGCG